MDTNNVLSVNGGQDVQINGVLESTLNSMTMAWTQMLSILAEANAKLSNGLNDQGSQMIDDLTTQFKDDVDKLNGYVQGLDTKSDEKRAEIQGEISALEAQMSELQQVNTSSASQAGSIADDASNKVKQDVDSSSSLVGSTASQIPQMIFGTTTQLTQQISA